MSDKSQESSINAADSDRTTADDFSSDIGFKAPQLPVPSTSSTETEAGIEQKDDLSCTETPPIVPPPPLKMSLAAPTLEYEAPDWACEPPDDAEYKLEVIKNGTIVDTIDMRKRKHNSYMIVGRLPSCDIVLEHPSMSRYHCILQYGEDTMGKKGKGWHMYDMGSTHGSKANRKKVPEKQYIKMHIGWVLHFGLSTRSLTLLGPEEEKDAEWDMSPTEMMEKMKKKALDRKLMAQAKAEFEESKRKEKEAAEKDEGIDWGMDYEVGDSGLLHLDNADAHLMEDHEAYYTEDPKKALAKFFDREGFDMDFTFSESGANSHNHKWTCSIELPVDTGSGRTLVASATVSTNKKDAQVQCALEACHILDSHGVLRKSTARSKLKRKTLEDNDFYEDDDDTYFDRTGQIEQQREKRRLRALGEGKQETKRETYDSLLAQLEVTKKEMVVIEKKLEELSATAEKPKVESGDNLDEFVKELTKGHLGMEDMKTKTEKSILRQRLVVLTHDSQRLEKLVKIAKPVALPELKVNPCGSSGGTSTADKQAFMRKMMMLGRKKKEEPSSSSVPSKEVTVNDSSKKKEYFVPEEEEDEEPSEESKGMALPPGMKKEESIEKGKDDKVTVSAEDTVVQETPPSTSETEKTDVVEEIVPEKKTEHRKRTIEEIKKDNEDAEREAEKELEEQAEKRRKRNRVYTKREKKQVDAGGDYGEGMVNKDDQYATWLPPDNQAGDGNTKLNEKFAGRY